MATNRLTFKHNPLKRFKLENETGFIYQLNLVRVRGIEYSNEELSKVFAYRYPKTCSTIRGKDVQSILDWLAANHECRNESHTDFAVRNKYGIGDQEVQDVLREWDFDIDKANRR